MLFKLGLTGSIATGKSTALDLFADLGYPVFSADQAVHDLYEGEAVAALNKEFPQIVTANAIDRRALAEYLTKHPHKIAVLEAIIHPMVQKKYQQFIHNLSPQNQLAVIDIPLLYEGTYDYGLDAVALTYCDPSVQRQRALARPGMTEKKLETILNRQMSQDQKKQRANYLINTNGSLLDTKTQVVEIAKQCLEIVQN